MQGGRAFREVSNLSESARLRASPTSAAQILDAALNRVAPFDPRVNPASVPGWRTGKARRIEKREAIPFTWPSKVKVANEYIAEWKILADDQLVQLKLSRKTLDTIASHVSRRTGTIAMSDKAIAARSGRSLASTERDVSRLKQLGFLIAEYTPADGRRGRERTLKISIPTHGNNPQRIPTEIAADCPSTYTPYVEGIEKGGRRDV